MPGSKRIFKVAMIAVAIFIGLTAVASASYYVYEHRDEIPIIKNFFEEESNDNDGDRTGGEEDADAAPTWTIEIQNGNVVKAYPNGSNTILADKEDYDNIMEFTYVATSPDYERMCFLGQTVAPMLMYVARTDGTEVTEDGIAQTCVWSNDSTMIAYTTHTTDVSPHDVHVYFLSTEESTNFTRHLSTEHVMRVYQDPEWSDDDTTITSLYNSYDDLDDWAQTTGYSIINVATGDVRDVSSPVDTSSWSTFEHEDSGITLKYPADWSVTEICDPPTGEMCGIEATDGTYLWTLDIDPFVTGGGFGFLFDSISLSTSIRTVLSIDGYTVYLLANYYDGAALATEMSNQTIPAEEKPWGWSVTFSDPNDYSTLGFGPGVMYDEIENNRWSIMYRYDLEYPNEGAVDFSDLPVMGDTDLTEAILIMNAISESIQLPE